MSATLSRLNVLLEYHKAFAVEMDAFSAILKEVKQHCRLLPTYEPSVDECKLGNDEPSWVSGSCG